jgi:lipopolysaccharide export system protein LptA
MAAEEPRRAPVNLRADRIELDQRTGASRYRGHVVLVQGTLKLTAERAEASAPGGVIRQITAWGNPATFREQLENGQGVIEGEAKQLDYDAVQRSVVLTGAVELRRADDRIRAARLQYNLDPRTSQAEGGDGQRVYTALRPQRPVPAEAPAAETPPGEKP